MTELIWDGKYKDGKKVTPVRIALPFQTIETINESAQQRQKTFDFFAAEPGDAYKEWRNRLIWGDKKYVLPSLLPEFAGKVNLIYIDPPFNVGSDFSFTASIGSNPDTNEEGASFVKEPSIIEQKAYRDTWGKGLDSYMQWFYETAILLRELLAENGSIYVHLDWHVGHYAKTILDEVFGYENFRNEVVWKRTFAHGNVGQGTKRFGPLHDVVLYYSKNEEYIFNQLFTPYDEAFINQFYKNIDPDSGRRYQLTSTTGPGGSSKGNPYYEFLGVKRYWRYSQENMNNLYAQGRIIQTKPGTVPRYKRYLDEMQGIPMQDIWTDIAPLQGQSIEYSNYATQKPETLLERVIKTSSNEGDLILDCFCGSGTTAAVAEKLNRR